METTKKNTKYYSMRVKAFKHQGYLSTHIAIQLSEIRWHGQVLLGRPVGRLWSPNADRVSSYHSHLI
jgi:hypothetical protein